MVGKGTVPGKSGWAGHGVGGASRGRDLDEDVAWGQIGGSAGAERAGPVRIGRLEVGLMEESGNVGGKVFPSRPVAEFPWPTSSPCPCILQAAP